MTLLSIAHLSYQVGNRILLKDICWQVEKGENWCVFGLNGSGKTTLLSIAAGYLPADPGAVTLLGEELTADNRQRLCAQMGLVSDAFFARCYRQEAVLDVVLSGLGGRLGLTFGVNEAKLGQAKRLLRAFGLAGLSRKPIALLSKGEQKKALLVRALLARPKLLFLDAPCAGLDVLSRLRVLELFRYLAREAQMTLVCVTHHFDEILDIYEHVLLLKAGMVHSQGPRQIMFAKDNLSDFLGQPAAVSRSAEGALAITLTKAQPAKQGGDQCGISL